MTTLKILPMSKYHHSPPVAVHCLEICPDGVCRILHIPNNFINDDMVIFHLFDVVEGI